MKTFYELRQYLGIGQFPSQYFEERCKQTGDTYLIQGAWDIVEYSPGFKPRLIRKKYTL